MENNPGKSKSPAVRSAILVACVGCAYGAVGAIALIVGGKPSVQDVFWHALAVVCLCATSVLCIWAAIIARTPLWAALKTSRFGLVLGATFIILRIMFWSPLASRMCWSPGRFALHALLAIASVWGAHVATIATMKSSPSNYRRISFVVLDSPVHGKITFRNNDSYKPYASIIVYPRSWMLECIERENRNTYWGWLEKWLQWYRLKAYIDEVPELVEQGWPKSRIRSELETCFAACEHLPLPGAETSPADQQAFDQFVAASGWRDLEQLTPQSSATVKVEGQRAWVRAGSYYQMLDAKHGYTVTVSPSTESITQYRSPIPLLLLFYFSSLILLAPLCYFRYALIFKRSTPPRRKILRRSPHAPSPVHPTPPGNTQNQE